MDKHIHILRVRGVCNAMDDLYDVVLRDHEGSEGKKRWEPRYTEPVAVRSIMG